jgi:conjugative relaxase-like TrwC/TraI family protein
MLIATQSKNAVATRQYFETVLTQGDYYLGQEIAGQWHGLGADILGLGIGSNVTREQFAALLAARHPVTGKSLAQRIRKDRRPGMDLTFSVPKSVSLAWAINGDERIIEVLREAVRETMSRDVEPLMMRRVRTGDKAFTKERTQTGKLLYADFLHKTSRPVEGKADPHLHIHAFVINWTQENGVHFAGEFEEIVRQRPSLQAKFEARLAGKLQRGLGYAVEKSQFHQSGRLKSGWEIAGLDRSTIEKFSRRTAQVEAAAREKGITDDAEKACLGKKTREKKDKGASIDSLREEWRYRLTEQERATFPNLGKSQGQQDGRSDEERAVKALQFALDHHLFRQSTVERHQVVGTALEHAVTLSPELIEKTLNQMPVIRRTREVEGAKRELVTTREVLNAERELIAYARDGRGTRKAIGKEHEFSRTWLNDQQKSAVLHVLQSRDAVTGVTGGAGTGKTSLMMETAEAINKNGKGVFVFAPSTGAREVLQEKGFHYAQTVEHLLRNEKLQAQVRECVIWVDEAGLLDVRSMRAVFAIAKKQNARVVLSGDTRQHASPRRGEALRLLEKEAGLSTARVETIQRQKGKYQEAVQLISRGHEIVDAKSGKSGLTAGFDLLDQLGKIKEVSAEQRFDLIAEKYLATHSKNKPSLVIAPTHAEAATVTEKIRAGLRQKSLLTREERSFTQLRSLNLTEAEKGQSATFFGRDDLIVQFHQNTKGGFKRGDRYRVERTEGDQVALKSLDEKHFAWLPLGMAHRFEVYRETKLGVSVGDKVRFSLGGAAIDGKRRISNGRLDEVQSIDTKGNLVLKSGMTVSKEYGHLDLGYVVTSHASQGKDKAVAIAAMGSESLPAINARQFYVTVSRGSEDVAIYVDDKAKIRQAIARSGEQLSATELVSIRSEYAISAGSAEAVWPRETHRHQSLFRNFHGRLVGWCRSIGERAFGGERQASPTPGGSMGMGASPGMQRSM